MKLTFLNYLDYMGQLDLYEAYLETSKDYSGNQKKRLEAHDKISELKHAYNNIRALSWKQPFAELMLHGKIETRTWSTKYRGAVIICASKSGYPEKQIIEITGPENYDRIQRLVNPKKAVKGKAIAIGRLVDCRPMVPEDVEKCFVKYHTPVHIEGTKRFKRLFCHIYEDVVRIDPFGWKGTQGWRTLDEKTRDRVIIIK